MFRPTEHSRLLLRRLTGSAFVLTATLLLSSSSGLAFQGSEGRRGETASPARDAGVEAAHTAGSQEAIDGARSRQRSFERARRLRLPRTTIRRGRCDEVVGRYCFWHEEDPSWEPPPEPEETSEARRELIERLEETFGVHPRSGWIAGQLVRYRVEAGRHEEALEAALECGRRARAGESRDGRRRGDPAGAAADDEAVEPASDWWCDALAGYVLHADERFGAADSAFSVALARMPRDTLCEWTDLSLLLEGEAARRYDELECGERRAFERTFWRLADPLYLVPGNDRRTEHFARRVMDRMQADAASAYGSRWGDDLRELLIRYGWPVAFQRERPGYGPAISSRPAVIARHDPASLHFLPGDEWPQRTPSPEANVWRLDHPDSRSRYAAPHASSFGELEHELAVFPRGDSSWIVAAFRMDPDSLPAAAEVDVLLSAASADDLAREGGGSGATGAHHAPAATLESRRELTGAVALAVETRPRLISLEALSLEEKRAERSRYGLALAARPEGVVLISDLLFLVEAESPPATLEEAAPLARPPAPARPGERIGLYWELSHLPPRPFTVTVTLEREGGGWLRSVGEWLGVVGEESAVVSIGWRDDRGEGRRRESRSLYLTLPEDLPDGDYRVEVAVELPGFEPLVRGRSLEVAEQRR